MVEAREAREAVDGRDAMDAMDAVDARETVKEPEEVDAMDARDGRDARDAVDARETVKAPEVYKDGGSVQPPPTEGVPQTRAPTNKRTGWVMDNRSSYVANRATGVLKKSVLTVLLAPTEKV